MPHLNETFIPIVLPVSGYIYRNFFSVGIGRPTRKDTWFKTEQEMNLSWICPECGLCPSVMVPASPHQLLRGEGGWWPCSALFPFVLSCPSSKEPWIPQFHTPIGRYIVLCSLPLGYPSDTKSFWDWKWPVLQTNRCHLQQGNFYSLV